MRDTYIIGVGMTPLGKHLDKELKDLGRVACTRALEDAGLNPKEIQTGYCGNALGQMMQTEAGIAQNVFWEVGINKIPMINVENACCSGGTALRGAWMSVASGEYDIAMAVGVEKTYLETGGILEIGHGDLELKLGLVLPAYFGLAARHYMEETGITKEELAQIAVKNRFHGTLNPYSQFQTTVTTEEVLNSPMISDPLTRLSCCPLSDGAAAAIVVSDEVRKRLGKKKIRIAAAVLQSGTWENPLNPSWWDIVDRAAKEAYNRAGIGPEDVSLAEVHDCYTISEVLHYETLGFAKRGEAARLIRDKETYLGGKIPFSVSGGLLAKGHPTGCTGIAQIVDAVWQLRGEAGKRQVENAKVALTHTMGGVKGPEAKAVSVNILVKE
jgi:acetyl-CoA acetyltransferase